VKPLKPLWLHLSAKILPLALLIFLIGSGVQVMLAGQLQDRIATTQLNEGGTSYADSIDRYLHSLVSQIESMSENSIVVNALIDFSGRQDYLPLFLETVGVFGRTDIAVRLVDFQNQPIESNFLGSSITFPESLLWEDDVLESGQRWIHIDQSGISIAQPVLNHGFAEGAILVHVSLKVLSEGLSNINAGYNRLILTEGYRILYSSVTNGFPVGERVMSSEDWLWSSQILSNDFGIATRVFKPIGQLGLLRGELIPLIAVSSLVIAISIFLILFISVRRVKDTVSVLSDAIAITNKSQDLGSRVDNTDSPLELARLGEQFNQMMSELQLTTTSRDGIDSILKSMSEYVVVCDKLFNVVLSNQSNFDVEKRGVDLYVGAPLNHSIYLENLAVINYEQVLHNKTVLWRKSKLIVGGEYQGWVFIGSDISEIKEAQKQMQLLELAIDGASHGVIISDATTNEQPVVFANQSFTDITGYSSEQVLGRKCDFLQGEGSDTSTRNKVSTSIRQCEPVVVEILNYKKDGTPFWNNLSIDPVFNDEGEATHFLGVLRDITHIVNAREELHLAKESAEAAAMAKSEFLATMSHEIRTPMNGVLGMLGLLMNTGLNEEQTHRAKIAQSSARSLLVLINDILDFSKIEAGKLDLEVIDFNLREMLGEFAEAMAHQAQAKGLELILDLSGVDASMVRGDSGRIRQILTNLVGNSIKFTHQGEVLIQISLIEENDQWRLLGRIVDSGIGIPSEKLPTLFEAFKQVDASTTRKFGGTGLGLAIVRQLCELMGGDIRVMSEIGRGSVFEFEILIDQSARSQLMRPSIDISELNILIVDDNRTNLDVLRSQLKHWGANVTEAVGGEDALRICQQRSEALELPFFDIAILDMSMPNMDGAELGRQIRTHHAYASMKLVMMTSMSFHGDRQNLADIGFEAYFPKPATTADLFKALNVLSEGGEAQERADPLITHEYLNSLQSEGGETSFLFTHMTRLLLVEDNQINQLVALGILEGFGLTAECAVDGFEALASLNCAEQDAPYTLILMDCQMPEMDGYEATRQIRAGKGGAIHKNVPIIAMTANVMQGDKEKCLDVGMNDYLPKPLEQEQLLNKLIQWVKPEEELGEVQSEPTQLKLDKQRLDTQKQGTPKQEIPNQTTEWVTWDEDSVLARIMGKENILVSMIQVYMKERDARMNELAKVMDARDYQSAQHLIHTLKGISGNLSAANLHSICELLESLIKAGEEEAITAKFQECISAEVELARVLEPWLESRVDVAEGNTEALPISVNEVADILKSLFIALSNDEFIDSDTYKPLESIINSEQTVHGLHELVESLNQFDNEAAKQSLARVADALAVPLE